MLGRTDTAKKSTHITSKFFSCLRDRHTVRDRERQAETDMQRETETYGER